MSPVEKRVAMKSLKKKGFEEDVSKEHIWYYHKFQGKETGIKTCVSHTKKIKDISGDLLTAMKNQLKLDTSEQVVDFLKCPMSRKDYLRVLEDKGFLSFS